MRQINFPFEKVLNLQTRERDTLQSRYSDAIKDFEKIGTELYTLLKKKEQFEQNQLNAMSAGVQLYEIQRSQSYLEKLLKQIEVVQAKLMKARAHMEDMNVKLLSKSIELKKYEKLKERFKFQLLSELNRVDQIQMDEISSLRSTKALR